MRKFAWVALLLAGCANDPEFNIDLYNWDIEKDLVGQSIPSDDIVWTVGHDDYLRVNVLKHIRYTDNRTLFVRAAVETRKSSLPKVAYQGTILFEYYYEPLQKKFLFRRFHGNGMKLKLLVE